MMKGLVEISSEQIYGGLVNVAVIIGIILRIGLIRIIYGAQESAIRRIHSYRQNNVQSYGDKAALISQIHSVKYKSSQLNSSFSLNPDEQEILEKADARVYEIDFFLAY